MQIPLDALGRAHNVIGHVEGNANFSTVSAGGMRTSFLRESKVLISALQRPSRRTTRLVELIAGNSPPGAQLSTRDSPWLTSLRLDLRRLSFLYPNLVKRPSARRRWTNTPRLAEAKRKPLQYPCSRTVPRMVPTRISRSASCKMAVSQCLDQ
jgi:hypothetical protein